MQTLREVGPDEFLAASIVEGVTRGGIASLRHFPTRRYRYLYDVTLTDGRRVIVRIGLPEERAALLQAAFWTDQLRAVGLPLPEILARDPDSLFPSLVTERLPGSRLGRALARLSRPVVGMLAGTMADQQNLVARLPSSGRFGWSGDPDAVPHESWAAAMTEAVETGTARIRAAGLVDPGFANALRRHVDRATPSLDGVLAIPFIADPATAIVVVTDGGQMSGLVDVNGLCWGDPRFAPAATLVSLLNAGLPAGFAEAWLALGGHAPDRLFWLYAGIALVQAMAEYGRTDLGTASGFTASDRRRLKMLAALMLERIAG
jgi:hypothetical protein